MKAREERVLSPPNHSACRSEPQSLRQTGPFFHFQTQWSRIKSVIDSQHTQWKLLAGWLAAGMRCARRCWSGALRSRWC